MIKYSDLVKYTKENHINWNTDLFDVLRGFFNQYSQPLPLPSPSSATVPLVSTKGSSSPPIQQELPFAYDSIERFMQIATGKFKEPANGEYTYQDVLNLFST